MISNLTSLGSGEEEDYQILRRPLTSIEGSARLSSRIGELATADGDSYNQVFEPMSKQHKKNYLIKRGKKGSGVPAGNPNAMYQSKLLIFDLPR